jgi:hypothetical protein
MIRLVGLGPVPLTGGTTPRRRRMRGSRAADPFVGTLFIRAGAPFAAIPIRSSLVTSWAPATPGGCRLVIPFGTKSDHRSLESASCVALWVMRIRAIGTRARSSRRANCPRPPTTGGKNVHADRDAGEALHFRPNASLAQSLHGPNPGRARPLFQPDGANETGRERELVAIHPYYFIRGSSPHARRRSSRTL